MGAFLEVNNFGVSIMSEMKFEFGRENTDHYRGKFSICAIPLTYPEKVPILRRNLCNIAIYHTPTLKLIQIMNFQW